MAPGKIAVIFASTSFAITNYREDLIRLMLSRGFRVVAVANHDPAGQRRLLAIGAEPLSLPFDPGGMNPFVDMKSLFFLTVILCRLRPDIVISSATKPVIWGSIAARLSGVPKVFALVTGLGFAFTGQPTGRRRLLRAALVWLYKLALSRVDCIVFENEDDRSELIERGIVSADRTVRIYGAGVNETHFSMKPVQYDMHFLYAGRMLREKGVAELCAAASAVRKRYPKSRFTLLGPCDEPNPGSFTRKDMENFVCAGVVEWLPAVQDVRPFIEAASVFVLPSYREGISRATLEAMAMGRPIVTTDAIGCRETVVDGENGFIVPVGDVAALERAMASFCENPSLIPEMGRRSRQMVEDTFSATKVNGDLMRIILS